MVAINAEPETKKFKVELPMFAGKAVDAYTERAPKKNEGELPVPSLNLVRIPDSGVYEFNLPSGGGAVLVK